ncbi:hypothetical protein [Aureimonas sp. AU12]|uniref:hypothetical protein n=1 Tax=Aureimonas sp. AU12 TaxID=1638161 RepID=UPI0012E38515|nr:hypothetical protein [Aureimonas sp. AU12]
MGGSIDRLGFEKLSFLVTTGDWTNGSHAVVAEESADNANWTAVPAASLTKALPTVDAAGKGNASTLVGYLGDARYVRVKANVSGSPATGAVVGVVVLLAGARAKPVQ